MEVMTVSSPTKRSPRSALAKRSRRFLVAADDSKGIPVTGKIGLESLLLGGTSPVSPLLFGGADHVVSNLPVLSSLYGKDTRSDLHVSLKLRLASTRPDLLSSHVRECIQSVAALLEIDSIDSLTLQLPSSVYDVCEPDPDGASRRKSVRIDQSQLLPQQQTPSESARDVAVMRGVSDALKISEIPIQTVGVSSASVATLERFLNAFDTNMDQRADAKWLKNVVLDLSPSHPTNLIMGTEAVEQIVRSKGLTLFVSKDGLAKNWFDGLVYSSDGVDNEEISISWTAKYSIFSTSRSVLVGTGQVVMASLA